MLQRVTRIVGVEPFLVEPQELAAALQKKFACATTVGELLGKQQGAEILLQGNVPEKVRHAHVTIMDCLSW